MSARIFQNLLQDLTGGIISVVDYVTIDSKTSMMTLLIYGWIELVSRRYL
jgi:hypothetical protein